MKTRILSILTALFLLGIVSTISAQDVPPARDDDKTVVVPLNRGWNMISTNIQLPVSFYQRSTDRAPSVVKVMEKIQPSEARDNVALIKNGDGYFYTPEWDYCNIEYWNSLEGYQILVSDDCDLILTGRPIDPQTEIPLHRGWNLVSYLPDYSLSVEAPNYHALESILDVLLLAKDGDGRFLEVLRGVSNIPAWRETRGYQIRVTEDATLIYPPDIIDISAQPIIEPRAKNEGQVENLSPIRTSAFNMSLLVEGITAGESSTRSSIQAVDNIGVVVGSGQLSADGRCGLAVWGDDGIEEDDWGLFEDESFTLELVSGNSITPLTLDHVLTGNGLVFSANSLSVVNVKPINLPQRLEILGAYPNPFNNATKIKVAIDATQDVSVKLYNLNGQCLKTLHHGEMTAGKHTLIWNAEDISAGIYFCRLTGINTEKTMKITLMK